MTIGTPAWLIDSSAAGAASIHAPEIMNTFTFWLSRSSTSEVSLATSPLASVDRTLTFEKWLASSFTAASMPTK